MPVAKPLRRSPRLTLSPKPIPKPNSVAGERKTPHNKQALALAFADPQPLNIYHPKPQKPYLLHASSSSSSALRRSPRLLGASIGVSKGQCGSELLLNLSEKKACKLARVCLDDNDLSVKCLRSRNLRMTSSSPPAISPVSGKRKLDSRRSSDETPRFSGEKAGDENEGKLGKKSEGLSLALSSSSMAGSLGKCRKLDSRRHSEAMPANQGSLRRSPRFSGPGAGGERWRRSEDVTLQSLPSSSMAGEVVTSGKLESRKTSKFSDETPVSGDETRGRTEIVPLPLMNSIMEEIFGKIEEERVLRRSPRGLSSICLVDDYECDEMKELPQPSSKKKKKEQEKATKERREKMNVSGSSSPSSIDKKEQDKATKERSRKCSFVGDAVPQEEAHQRWEWRYQSKNRRSKGRSLTANDEEDEPILKVKCHYIEAQINGCTFHLGDCALIRGEEGQEHIGRIMEFFQTIEGEDYFRCQWFYKAEDTVMKDAASFHDKKRVFYSTIMNDNLLDCIISKLKVVQVTPELISKAGSIPPSDFYYDMEYCLDYSTFRNLPRDNSVKGFELSSISCAEPVLSVTGTCLLENTSICEPFSAELSMLDIYAGCGAMSTGLCTGAKLSGVNLVTRWAIDLDSWACESLRLNHPETHVKNEAAEDFLELLKHWEKLCKKFVTEDVETHFPSPKEVSDAIEINSDAQSDSDDSDEELEVLRLVDISYGDTNESGKRGLKFKVRWKGYDPSEDTWEPIEGLSNCQDLIQEFVINGFKNKILPLPGDVDVICGGPPCQGISGYNRFRCVDDPLSDEKNRQLVVFMDIVEYLKPKFVLMENVTDILRFDKGSLGRYALSRLVHMNYQARVGIMAAGCYGLPQFRLRVFFWGAIPSEELPQFPLPTHDVVVRYWPPPEFERNVVGYEEGQPPELEDAVLLSDAFSDLPAVTNFESSDEMAYNKPPETEFQKYIRSIYYGSINSGPTAEEAVLYDHRPHQLFEDDYIRVCQIPRRKGANFRDLPGIVVGDDNVVRRDPATKPELLPSGRPMVPEYVFTFEHGKSKRPFGRLWWDETMATVVTYPNCHSQVVLHPEQDRVLTVRECARLQGFPDNYRFCGTVKKRYRQVGNAVAFPVAKALGYALGMASQKLIGKEPLMTLPPKFAYSNHL